MAISIQNPVVVKNVVKFDDTYTDTLSVTYPIDPSVLTNAVDGFYTALDSASEAKIASVNWVEDNVLIGQKPAALNAIQNLVSVQVVLAFDGTTANSKGQFPKFTVKIPSPSASTLNANGTINASDANIAAIIGFAQQSFMYEVGNVAGSTVPTYALGAVYNPSESGFITLPREIK